MRMPFVHSSEAGVLSGHASLLYVLVCPLLRNVPLTSPLPSGANLLLVHTLPPSSWLSQLFPRLSGVISVSKAAFPGYLAKILGYKDPGP